MVQLDQPFISILDGPIFILFTNGFIKVKAIHVTIRRGKIRIIKFDREVAVWVHFTAITLSHSVFFNFLYDSVTIRNGRQKDSFYE